MSFYEHYQNTILKNVQTKSNIENKMAIPKIEKIVINLGIWTYVKTIWKDFSSLIKDLTLITGQKPIVINAKKSVSNFKLREWMPVWLKVTLRW